MRIMIKTALAAVLGFGLMAPSVLKADIENQLTELTVKTPIEVPGATLQSGEYTMELAGTEQATPVVIFRNAKTQDPVAMAMTVSAKANQAPDQTEFRFYETAAGHPPVLRSWYYPGKVRGLEFVYPESRSKMIAKESRRHVPTASDEEYQKFSGSNDAEPALVAVRTVTFYTLSPDEQRASLEEGSAQNAAADQKAWSTSSYATRHEMANSNGKTMSADGRWSQSADHTPQTRLERQIRKEIVTLPYYSIWDHLEYQVNGNEVTLMGSVYRPSMKKSVERVVKNIEGVNTVVNDIEVQPTSPNDDRIRRAAYRAIYGNSALQDYQLRAVPPIHIIVDNGKLTLEGVVQNQLDKNVAGTEANTVNGVFEVTNNLRVES
ncbi:MAG: BON domain-containing protein [Bryobacterales bacterium]